MSTALITGFMAKESVVSTLLILFGSTAALSAALTPAQAAPLLVFCLLYTPCIAAVAAVKRELGGKWATIMVVNQCVVAWVCALLVRLVAVMLSEANKIEKTVVNSPSHRCAMTAPSEMGPLA